MKKIFVITLTLLAFMAAGSFTTFGGEGPMGAPVTHSKDFDRMKGLVGVWEGKVDMGHGMEQLKVAYELTSAGNAIVERFAAGKPHEMVTVYYDYDGMLAMTHYCSIGNQPHMELRNPGESTLKFVLSERAPGLASSHEMHMHALTIAIDGRDSVTQTWTLYDKGAMKNDVSVKLARSKK